MSTKLSTADVKPTWYDEPAEGPKQSRRQYQFFGAYEYFHIVDNLLSALQEGNGLDDDDRHTLVQETTNVLYILRTGSEM